jgi:hypothetical protein
VGCGSAQSGEASSPRPAPAGHSWRRWDPWPTRSCPWVSSWGCRPGPEAALWPGSPAVVLLAVDSKIVPEVATVIRGTLAGSIRAVNYAFYCAALAATVLIADDLLPPHQP